MLSHVKRINREQTRQFASKSECKKKYLLFRKPAPTWCDTLQSRATDGELITLGAIEWLDDTTLITKEVYNGVLKQITCTAPAFMFASNASAFPVLNEPVSANVVFPSGQTVVFLAHVDAELVGMKGDWELHLTVRVCGLCFYLLVKEINTLPLTSEMPYYSSKIVISKECAGFPQDKAFVPLSTQQARYNRIADVSDSFVGLRAAAANDLTWNHPLLLFVWLFLWFCK